MSEQVGGFASGFYGHLMEQAEMKARAQRAALDQQRFQLEQQREAALNAERLASAERAKQLMDREDAKWKLDKHDKEVAAHEKVVSKMKEGWIPDAAIIAERKRLGLPPLDLEPIPGTNGGRLVNAPLPTPEDIPTPAAPTETSGTVRLGEEPPIVSRGTEVPGIAPSFPGEVNPGLPMAGSGGPTPQDASNAIPAQLPGQPPPPVAAAPTGAPTAPQTPPTAIRVGGLQPGAYRGTPADQFIRMLQDRPANTSLNPAERARWDQLFGTAPPEPRAAATPNHASHDMWEAFDTKSGKTVPGIVSTVNGIPQVNGKELPAGVDVRRIPSKDHNDGSEDDFPLPADAIDMNAKFLAKTGTLPPLGQGKAARADRNRIFARAAKYDIPTDTFRVGPGDSPDLASSKAGFKADSATLTAQRGNYSTVEAFSKAAKMNADLLRGTLDKLPDSGVTLINGPWRAAATAFGDTTMTRFAGLRRSLQTEYARLIAQPTLKGQLTDTATKEMEVILNPSSTVAQIRMSLDTLAEESENRRKGMQQEMDATMARIRGNGAPNPNTGGTVDDYLREFSKKGKK